MKIKMKTWGELKPIVTPEIMSDGKNDFFIMTKTDEPGSIYPEMIKLTGEELEVEEDINPDTYIYKEYMSDKVYIENKIRGWMISA